MKIGHSLTPPVLKCHLLSFLLGQKGFIPSTVKESTNTCKEYPRKKGRAITGTNTASNIEIAMQNVKLWNNPLCFVKNLTIHPTFLPNVENSLSISGR